MPVYVVILRTSIALLIGTVIGIERERKNRPAGMRTHVLVCLGACMIAMIETEMQARIIASGATNVTLNMGRMIAQVVSGIGFLGAGTIFMTQKRVAGLTTAASLWNAACLGLAVGLGYYWIAGIGCALVMIVLSALARIVHVNAVKKVEVQFIHRKETMDYLNEYLARHNIRVEDLDFHVDNRQPNNVYTNTYVLHLPRELSYADIVQDISEFPNIMSVSTMNT
ncbi:MAG: MgtC/SapB family protein [Candidatus Fimadaptatus sp.]|jgi:putative Mg2+ transporter-C (MgtC) family protein